MTQPHYVTLRSGEDIFAALGRWKQTAPHGHRGNIYIRHPEQNRLGGRSSFPDDYRDEELRKSNPVVVDELGRRRVAIQSVADRLALTLLTEAGAGIDDGPLAESLRRRAVA